MQYNEAVETGILNTTTQTPARPQSAHRTVTEILSRAGHLLSSPTIGYVQQLSRAAERAISETIILQESNCQLRAANKKVSQNRRGKPRLTSARVLNDQQLDSLWQNKAMELDTRAVAANSTEKRGRGRPRGSSSGGRGRGLCRGRGGIARPRGRPRKNAQQNAQQNSLEGSREDSLEDSGEDSGEGSGEGDEEDSSYLDE